ncbi:MULTISPECIES: signal peptidase I [unclassified Streptomyces]|uniref:signal peptidase I n=1 Tax=unclassified Streptomyces TaxID=2593676 RepID=UPI002DDBD91B|nr:MULTISPECIES: signal peptidase I [unclassified Streptomyces]WSA92098.1 signal peptidase I [Streptomyces sp. NBC_01795]WSB76463.1 signal peptidase I [Streptomyces sp. NBC_01775]WSS15261.1 signal peptidase I [Streptomyces sp. NBC_01186]WSS44103.1 signal peptidase I [Streptomyces sp. NBC_01187]
MSKAIRTDEGHGRLGNRLSGLAVALGCVLFLGGFVWGAVLYQPYTVPTDSMHPTVKSDSRVLAERVDGEEVRRGDVVVFQDSVWGAVPMVKRVVGVGGDKVACCDKSGRLTVNGKPVEEPYLRSRGADSQRPFDSTDVPKGKLFLLGDNRLESLDSRVHLQDADHGAVPRSAVKGRVDAVAWPFGSLGMLPEATGFAAMPEGTSERGPLPLALAAVVVGAVLVLGGAAYGPIARRIASSAHGRSG